MHDRGVVPGGAGVGMPPQILADQLTLYENQGEGGQIMPTK